MYHPAISTRAAKGLTQEETRELISLYYDAALCNVKVARLKMEERNFQAKNEALETASRIIHELMDSTGPAARGETGGRLAMIYAYILRRMREADFLRDHTAFDEVVVLLEELGDAWRERTRNPRAGEGGPVFRDASRASGI